MAYSFLQVFSLIPDTARYIICPELLWPFINYLNTLVIVFI
jgi:hypothetical protein